MIDPETQIMDSEAPPSLQYAAMSQLRGTIARQESAEKRDYRYHQGNDVNSRDSKLATVLSNLKRLRLPYLKTRKMLLSDA